MFRSTGDEGMTNGPPIFAYLVFGPGRMSCEEAFEAHHDNGLVRFGSLPWRAS
jgi:hypothetical protein